MKAEAVFTAGQRPDILQHLHHSTFITIVGVSHNIKCSAPVQHCIYCTCASPLHMCESIAHVRVHCTCVSLSHMCESIAHVWVYRTCVSQSHMCESIAHVRVYRTCASLSHMCKSIAHVWVYVRVFQWEHSIALKMNKSHHILLLFTSKSNLLTCFKPGNTCIMYTLYMWPSRQMEHEPFPHTLQSKHTPLLYYAAAGTLG